jgi:catechol 2,3-dioxygenase-like lactoylglutathione lyase family enzyme
MVLSLDHVNIRVADIRKTLSFYSDVLGMRCGPVPGFRDMVESAWIYAGDDRPVLHVGTGTLAVSRASAAPSMGCGSIDHVALECLDYERFCARFVEWGIDARYNDVPMARLKQIFVTDPDGICLELNFRSS